MGYYVTMVDSTFRVKSDKLFDAFEAMRALNQTHHTAKRGGSYGPNGKTESWFSWMTPDYDETCKDAAEIFEMLGFTYDFDKDNGDLLLTEYDSKIGQEDLFLQAVAPFAEGGMNWIGEDGERWRNEVRDGKLVMLQAKISYE